MENKFKATVTTLIELPAPTVWHALTDPAMIKHYMWETEAISDWKKGSSIIYRGQWEGKPYEDKGMIVEIIPEKLLHTTYFSPLSGKDDKPENYNNVIYSLSEENDKTTITVTQDNIMSEEEKQKMESNWSMVLGAMKELLEK